MQEQAEFIFNIMINTFEIIRLPMQNSSSSRSRKECADLQQLVDKLEKANEKARLKIVGEIRHRLKRIHPG